MGVDREGLIRELRRSLKTLASPGARALRTLPENVVRSDELALDYDNFYKAYAGNFGEELTPTQSQALDLIDRLLSRMSGSPDADLWTDEAVISHPRWENVRQAAKRALSEMGWDDETTSAIKRPILEVPRHMKLLVIESLRDLTNTELLRKTWVQGLPGGPVSPSELVSQLFDDTALDLYLDRGLSIFTTSVDETLARISAAFDKLDLGTPPDALLGSSEWKNIQKLARDVLIGVGETEARE